MFTKLWSRFVLIIVLVLMCWGILSTYTLKPGIDLAGGIDLVYELDLAKYNGPDKSQLAAKVIDVLKRRIDPNGVKNLTWRAIAGGTRIEIQMPLAKPETIEARKEYQAAERELADMNLGESEVRAALRRTGEARVKALDALAAPGSARREALDKLVIAYDTQQRVIAEEAKFQAQNKGKPLPGALLAQDDIATQGYEDAFSELMKKNIDMSHVSDLLDAAASADSAQSDKAEDELNKLADDYPQQKDAIKKLRDAYANLQLHKGGGFDDPADLQRLLKGAGVLDFRIAVEPTADNEDAIKEAKKELSEGGPERTKVPNMKWFEIDPVNGAPLKKPSSRYVMSPDSKYILLYTDVGRSLTHGEERKVPWKLTNAQVSRDTNGNIIVEFKFDPAGGAYFGQMTGANVHKPMAILLDNRALSAPDINEPITTGSGQITFGGGPEDTRSAAEVQNEAETLVKMLEAGSLPATLNPDPVSVQTIGSELGADNIQAGLRSGIYAVIGVMGFMVIYYTLTGSFANLAVAINLMMTLSAMAVLGATFTLPGIAGIVLTLGMAVDANVLINERIREEVHKGASLWMAVRQGYDKVFWTIFDANTTTSLTSIVLIAVASEEVKGFGVTLLIGLIVHMFTALFVTRTLMIAAIKWGVMKQIDDHSIAEYIREIFTLTWLRKGRWPFMRVITVTNFDWIGKRHYFWVVSALVTVAGLAAFLARGSDKYDTEFNGGTQVTFKLTRPEKIEDVRAKINTGMVRDLERDARNASGAERARLEQMSRDLEQANVVTVGTDNTTFQLVTTIAERDSRNELLDRLQKKLGDELDVQKAISFKGANFVTGSTKPSAPGEVGMSVDQLRAEGLVYPVSTVETSLEKSVPGVLPADGADDDVSKFGGGVAIVLDDINPPMTKEALTARLALWRQKPDYAGAAFRDAKVVPVEYAEQAGGGAATQKSGAGHGQDGGATGERLVTKAVVLVADPAISYQAEGNNDAWETQLAGVEWNLARQALVTPGSFQGVTSFDAVVADTAKAQAIVALVVSLALIVIYVWIRFGGLRYGIGAILSLMHDAIVALAATVLAGEFVKFAPGVAKALLISDFKINLTMIAAYLTVIGYSVNDTIVIFDRIRENRGRGTGPLSAKLVNDSINQCFGRTIWTTFTVFMVVLIMYIWGGEGVRGFSYAMLIGVITGAYSTLAIAAPALLNVKELGGGKEVVKLARVREGDVIGE